MSETSADNRFRMFNPQTDPPGGLFAVPDIPPGSLIRGQFSFYDQDPKWQPPKNPLATFGCLPAELKHQIYGHLFHPPAEATRPCESVDFWTNEKRGCRCGESLSMVSREIYRDTRALFYNCAHFIFGTPTLCKRFNEVIGYNCLQVGSFELKYTNTVNESSLLQDVFEPFRASTKLVHLEFTIKARENGPYDSLPIYVPRRSSADRATLWDLEVRPMHHPLADLKALRKLTVRGHPGMIDMEEVFFRAGKNVENLAISQQRYQRTTATWTSEKMLSYTIESISGMLREYPTSEPCSPAGSQSGDDDPIDGLQW